MANYVKATDFAVKDGLLTGDPLKIVSGTEIDDEYNAIQTAINSKANTNSPAFTGSPTAPTATAGTNTTQLATTAFIQAALQSSYPVGSVYINASVSTNPSTLLGFGTWVAFGAGKVLVGFDATDPLFDAAEGTGGSKDAVLPTHFHSFSAVTSSAGAHTHFSFRDQGRGVINFTNDLNTTTAPAGHTTTGASDFNYGMRASTGLADVGLTSSHDGHAHNVSGNTGTEGVSATNANIQPYITVYLWKRTA